MGRAEDGRALFFPGAKVRFHRGQARIAVEALPAAVLTFG